MIKLFKKKKENNEESDLRNRIAQGIASKILFLQSSWAEWMQLQMGKLSLKGQGILIVLFFMSALTLCILSISGNPIFGKNLKINVKPHNKVIESNITPTDSLALMEKVYKQKD